MTDLALPIRRRRLWPVFIMPALVLVAAIAWSAFWFYAASQVDSNVDAWRAREAASGRSYDCANRSVTGFPFRLEVRCSGVTVALSSQTAGQTATQTPVTARLGEILVMSQVYDPKHLIAEFTAPAVFSERRQQPSMVLNWRTARSSVFGLPGIPQRADIVFDEPALDRIAASVQTPLARAGHVELHGRLAEGSTPDRPLIETVVGLAGASIQDLHPLLTEPFDLDARTLLSGLKDFSAKPWPERFREIQAAGGRVDLIQSRIAQGDVVATATGSLGLSASGRLDGELQMTVAGIEKIIPALGIDKVLEQGVPQETLDRLAPGVKTADVNNLMGALDRAIPGLSKIVRQNANVTVAAGISALGKETTLEGKKARAFPLRFVDGAVFLGPIKVAQTPALY